MSEQAYEITFDGFCRYRLLFHGLSNRRQNDWNNLIQTQSTSFGKEFLGLSPTSIRLLPRCIH